MREIPKAFLPHGVQTSLDHLLLAHIIVTINKQRQQVKIST